MFFNWHETDTNTLVITDKYNETGDTVTLRLTDLDESKLFEFKPGQFISVGVEIEGKREFRAYSLSGVSGDDYLQITVKRVNGGKVSNYLIDHILPGDTLYAYAPVGEFNCIDKPPVRLQNQTKALLISAGCGISPVMSMARHLLDCEPRIDVTFLHIARSPEETIYLDLLETLNQNYENFHLRILLKRQENTLYHEGRLDKQWITKLVPDLLEQTVYLCGPNQFMKDVEAYLTELNFDMSRFHQESFTPSESSLDSHCNEGVQVNVPAFNKHLNANKGEILADVLEREGLPIIIACRNGVCGACKCKITEGDFTITENSVLTPEEIAQGYSLACSSVLDGSVSVELN